MAPAEANDGELFGRSCGGVFPEEQRTPTTCLLFSLVRLEVNGGKLKDWCFFI
jgi:hypothetical protein